MKNFLYGFSIVLIVALVFVSVKYFKERNSSKIYLEEIAVLSQQSENLEVDKEVLFELIAELEDSLDNTEVDIKYVYVEIEAAEEVIAEITPDVSYEILNEIFPEENSASQIWPFSGGQVGELHLAVTERTLYAQLATQLQEGLNTSSEIIDLQNRALLKADSINGFERLKVEILMEQLAIAESKVERKTIFTYILGGAVLVEGAVIMILSNSK